MYRGSKKNLKHGLAKARLSKGQFTASFSGI